MTLLAVHGGEATLGSGLMVEVQSSDSSKATGEIVFGQPSELRISALAEGNETELSVVVSGSPGWSVPMGTLEVDVLERIDYLTVAIHAIAEENDDVQTMPVGEVGPANSICVSAGPNGFVDTIPHPEDAYLVQDSVVVAIHTGLDGICQTEVNNEDISADATPSASELESFLNEVWGTQANAYFTVERSDYTVNYDFNRDGDLEDVIFSNEETNAVSAVAENTEVSVNIYYVGKYGNPIGVRDERTNDIWTQGVSSTSPDVLIHTAHEMGHVLRGAGHWGEDTDLLMKEGNNPPKTCKINREDWRRTHTRHEQGNF